MRKLSVKLEDGTEAVLSVEGMVVTSMNFDGMEEIKGVREIRRASDVEFDITTQEWCAIIRPEFRRDDVSFHSFFNERRSVCLQWERRYLNGDDNV